MLVSPSSEFIALCRSQIALLTQGMGAALSIVYLTEELIEGETQAGLVPIAAYPDTAMVWEGANALALAPEVMNGGTPPRLPKVLQPENRSSTLTNSTQPLEPFSNVKFQQEQDESQRSLLPHRRMVLPLIYEGMMMGFLVTSREDRPWEEREKIEIEQIAQTLAIARLLDQRRSWLAAQLNQQQHTSARQRDLLDNLLHQFRNPLTALRTFGKLLIKRLKPGDANSTVANNILRESDRLSELLQQFDRVIELSSEAFPTKSLPSAPVILDGESYLLSVPLLPDAGASAEVILVADVLSPLVSSAEAIATERSLELKAEIPPNLQPIRANSKALREVLSNLIDNALKYTPSGGQVQIQAGLEQDNLQGISISDNGPGIPAQDLAHIFDRHYRGVQSNSGIPGTGLGLAIAKELIEQMQGKIQVFSPAIHPLSPDGGPGATFIIWLPIAIRDEKML